MDGKSQDEQYIYGVLLYIFEIAACVPRTLSEIASWRAHMLLTIAMRIQRCSAETMVTSKPEERMFLRVL
jgi:hypothetical protein